MKVQLATGLLTLLLGAPLALADKPGAGDQRAQHRAQMQEQFGVTDEQFSKMREIRENGGSREDAHSVLTDEQRTAMRKWREENPGRGPGHERKGRNGADSD